MTEPLVSFVIVTFNSAETIEGCITSIVQFTSMPFEVVVVDNSPGDATAAEVKRCIASHVGQKIVLDETDENLGFAKGCNRGASRALGKYLLFLNPDTELLGDAVTQLLDCMRIHPGTLAVGPAILDGEGRVTATCRNLPTAWRIVLDATGLDRWVGAYRLTRFSHRVPRRVDQIMGSAMLIPREAYSRMGGMDERFFIYYEEVDLCKRLMEAGGEVWFWPPAVIRHFAGISTEADPVRARMIYVLRDSRKKYFRKHFGRAGEFAIDVINRLEGLGKWAVLSAAFCLRAEPLIVKKHEVFYRWRGEARHRIEEVHVPCHRLHGKASHFGRYAISRSSIHSAGSA